MNDQINEKHIVRWANVTPVEMVPGLFRRTLGETDALMVIEVRANAGAVIPQHSHPHEQVGFCISGEIHLTIDGILYVCKPGDSWAIPGNVVHSAVFPVESVVTDTFSPPREDYR